MPVGRLLHGVRGAAIAGGARLRGARGGVGKEGHGGAALPLEGLPKEAKALQRKVQAGHPHEGAHQGEALQVRGEGWKRFQRSCAKSVVAFYDDFGRCWEEREDDGWAFKYANERVFQS